MNPCTIVDQYGHKFERITKQEAYKRWIRGDENIALCPHKLRPGYPWSPHMLMVPYQEYKRDQIDGDTQLPHELFNRHVRNFAWYNCQQNETGYYPAFYAYTPSERMIAHG